MVCLWILTLVVTPLLVHGDHFASSSTGSSSSSSSSSSTTSQSALTSTILTSSSSSTAPTHSSTDEPAYWDQSLYSPCSASCGYGLQYSILRCLNSSNPIQVLPSVHCRQAPAPTVLNRACQLAPCLNRWRPDGRCGEDYPAPDGSPISICDLNGPTPCCSSKSQCSNTYLSCTCDLCIDYRLGNMTRGSVKSDDNGSSSSGISSTNMMIVIIFSVLVFALCLVVVVLKYNRWRKRRLTTYHAKNGTHAGAPSTREAFGPTTTPSGVLIAQNANFAMPTLANMTHQTTDGNGNRHTQRNGRMSNNGTSVTVTNGTRTIVPYPSASEPSSHRHQYGNVVIHMPKPSAPSSSSATPATTIRSLNVAPALHPHQQHQHSSIYPPPTSPFASPSLRISQRHLQSEAYTLSARDIVIESDDDDADIEVERDDHDPSSHQPSPHYSHPHTSHSHRLVNARAHLLPSPSPSPPQQSLPLASRSEIKASTSTHAMIPTSSSPLALIDRNHTTSFGLHSAQLSAQLNGGLNPTPLPPTPNRPRSLSSTSSSSSSSPTKLRSPGMIGAGAGSARHAHRLLSPPTPIRPTNNKPISHHAGVSAISSSAAIAPSLSPASAAALGAITSTTTSSHLPCDSSHDTDPTICTICYSSTADALVIPCGHNSFCHDCLTRWRGERNVCPVCRFKIEAISMRSNHKSNTKTTNATQR